MKLLAETRETSYEIDIKREGGKVFADVGGRKYVLDTSEPEPNVFLLKNEGQVFEATVLTPANPNDAISVRVRNQEFEFHIVDPKRLRGTSAIEDQSSGRAEIKTAMPGKVVRILVSEGAAVQKGDGIVVVEAMKMQNEMKSPKDGIVVEIRVAENDTVGAGDTLIIID